MAVFTGLKVEKKIEPTITVIDMLIIEHIYSAEFFEIIEDDGLMDLILSNGFYKQALCDAFGVEELCLNHRGVDYHLYGSPKNRLDTYEQIVSPDECKMVGVEIINGD